MNNPETLGWDSTSCHLHRISTTRCCANSRSTSSENSPWRIDRSSSRRSGCRNFNTNHRALSSRYRLPLLTRSAANRNLVTQSHENHTRSAAELRPLPIQQLHSTRSSHNSTFLWPTREKPLIPRSLMHCPSVREHCPACLPFVSKLTCLLTSNEDRAAPRGIAHPPTAAQASEGCFLRVGRIKLGSRGAAAGQARCPATPAFSHTIRLLALWRHSTAPHEALSRQPSPGSEPRVVGAHCTLLSRLDS